ncbi:hydroxymethylglutaryl-CoA lyase [Alicyclobacillus sp. ALC3]|uniref:hydroxymethylglutaryl-CoA lyase n=1 Tax=Alicyclobacillus sp. ALC3 TaxID=2796143 RepID=UPI002377D324|nr:hydroxymethylglutaryl-CoA lyase [Alicyclobacillus sp. ALC3]WDL96034.1 hydroxymethylglutaryl-CoA lyase [Alicyclobacillus sp. ALC3]
MTEWPTFVEVVDVTPRDGLQDETGELTTEEKIQLIRDLRAAGVRRIEATSFVSPKWIPQLRDAEQVLAGLAECDNLIALVPNVRGFERALATVARELTFVVSASPRHQMDNLHMSLDASLANFQAIVQATEAGTVRLRGAISCAFGSPFHEEMIRPDEVAAIAKSLVHHGAAEVSLADTVGLGKPDFVRRVITAVQDAVPSTPLALHLHDRYGLALGNVVAALFCGVTTIESALGGLGGCPYAPDAPGNLNTEDLVRWFHLMGIETGIDLEMLGSVRKRLLGQLAQAETRQGELRT